MPKRSALAFRFSSSVRAASDSGFAASAAVAAAVAAAIWSSRGAGCERQCPIGQELCEATRDAPGLLPLEAGSPSLAAQFLSLQLEVLSPAAQ